MCMEQLLEAGFTLSSVVCHEFGLQALEDAPNRRGCWRSRRGKSRGVLYGQYACEKEDYSPTSLVSNLPIFFENR